jgi:hypothetical protein
MAKLNVALEPLIPVSTEFKTIAQIRNIVCQLDIGNFYWPAILVERMLWNPRLRGAMETRLNGLIATQIRWEPARNNRSARKAAAELAMDWPKMAPAPQRRQFGKWGLLMGLSLAQRIPFTSPTSGRRLFRLRPYWPGWSIWDQTQDRYIIERRDGAPVSVESPSMALTRPVPAASPWVIHEPWGEHSWREALAHAVWRAWFGHELGFRDLNRGSEKLGIGITKAKYPAGDDDAGKKQNRAFANDLRNVGSEPTVGLEQRPQGEPSFDIEPFEFRGTGHEMINSALNTAAIAMAIVLLGHNLTTEVKGGSYAAAGVGEFIRSDIKATDGEAEAATLVPQLIVPWAIENHGDPELAPQAVYVSDPPSVNLAMAQTYQALGLAIRELKQWIPSLDVDALAERFRLPLKLLDKAQEAVPTIAPATPAPATPATTPQEVQP